MCRQGCRSCVIFVALLQCRLNASVLGDRRRCGVLWTQVEGPARSFGLGGGGIFVLCPTEAPLVGTQNRSACAHVVRSSAAEGPSRRD